MVDAEAVEPPLPQPAEHEGVGVREYPLVLHAQADQGVDVEEAPVVELLIGGAPEGRPGVLALEQIVEAGGLAGGLLFDPPGRGGGPRRLSRGGGGGGGGAPPSPGAPGGAPPGRGG